MMQKTRKYFSQDLLISKIKKAITDSIKPVSIRKNGSISDTDCLMSALAMFSFKFPTMLQFDEQYKADEALKQNIANLFGVQQVLSDTSIRERVDLIDPSSLRSSFTRIFALLQRGHLLDHFRFMDQYYLISLDGTGYFSSASINCDQCCIKEHKNGSKTYYHQMLSAALVHPEQKVVYPFAPEPILKQDGIEKNDCERNAAKRWLQEFRREHPHLSVVIVADGLSSNSPFIELLKQYNMHFILVCQEADHRYLMDWVNNADEVDAPSLEIKDGKIGRKYQYMHDVPLNSSSKTTVNVLRYWETKNNQTSKWIWVTDLKINNANVKQIMQGGRARWRIENETFNTLKNQGYNFEHNYGHGYKNLSTVLAFLMLLSFFIDQVLQAVNKRFYAALQHVRAKRILWESMRSVLRTYIIPSFESLYEVIVHPPPPIVLSNITQS